MSNKYDGYMGCYLYDKSPEYWRFRLKEAEYADRMLAYVLAEFCRKSKKYRYIDAAGIRRIIEKWETIICDIIENEDKYKFYNFRLGSRKAWAEIIRIYFKTPFENCDYSIMHFLSKTVLINRIHEFMRKHDYFRKNTKYRDYYSYGKMDVDKYRDEIAVSIYNKALDKKIPYENILEKLNSKSNIMNESYREPIRKRWIEGFREADFYIVIDLKTKQWKGTPIEKHLKPWTLFGRKYLQYLSEARDYYSDRKY